MKQGEAVDRNGHATGSGKATIAVADRAGFERLPRYCPISVFRQNNKTLPACMKQAGSVLGSRRKGIIRPP